jgi:hypothetical protein
MGGRLPLTMRGASIGSSRSAETPTKTRELERPAQRCRALPPTPAASHRQPVAALKPRPARRENTFSANALVANNIGLGGALHKSQRGR